jgi:hypothetical protein
MKWHPGQGKRHCKYHIGLPILSRDPFLQKYTKRISEMLKPMNYGERLEMMDFMSCTSLMDVKQKTEYMDWMVRDFAEQGLELKSNKEK